MDCHPYDGKTSVKYLGTNRSVSQAHAKSIVGREIRKLGHLSFTLDVNREDIQCVSQAVLVLIFVPGCPSKRLYAYRDCEVVIHHGGKLVNEGCLKYVGENDTMYFDPDKWSYFVVLSVVKTLGYDGFKDLWYSVGCGPVLDDKLEPLSDDLGATHMVHLYVVHIVSEPDVIHMIEYNVHEGGEEVEPEMHEGGECVVLDERTKEDDNGVTTQLDEGVGGQCERIQVVFGKGGSMEDDVEGGRIQDDEAHDERTEANDVEGDTIEVDEGDDVEGERIEDDEGDDERIGAINVEETIVVDVGGDDSTKANDVEGERIEDDEGDDERKKPNDVEETIVVDVAHDEMTAVNDDVEDDDNGEVSSMDDLVDINIQCEYRDSDTCDLEDDDISDTSLFNDECEYEDLSSPEISDEESDVEEEYGKFITFNMPKNMIDFKWEVGTYFGQKKDIMDAIKTYALKNERNMKFIKNDKKRIRLKCVGAKGECPWMAYFGYMETIDTWQLRTVVDRQSCSREHKLGVFNAKWLSKKLEKTMRENPNVKGVDIRDKISRIWNIAIYKNMAYRAKAYASDEVEGSFTMQYCRIYDYAHELLARNPGSTIKVAIQENDGKHILLRFYACLKACKDSFVSCRPIIGLDGAFLKGRHHRELLTVVARDANDQMIPLAYAIVAVENKDTWSWFMELLIEDLGGPKVCSSLTLISDQQKGLLPAVQNLLPGVALRFCVRHLYANFRKKFPRKNLKKLMWRAVTSTHPQKWENEMRSIREVNEDAFRYLIAILPRSRFTTTAQCDTLVNNMLEAFNSVLVHTRTKPIITMLEKIRLYMMKRWATNRSRTTKGGSTNKVLDSKIFEVRHVSQSGKKFVVNIDEYSCSCKKWSISGLPCVHVLATMRFLNLDGEDCIHVCFLTSTYEEMYSSIIYPINGNNMWEVTQYPDVMSPSKRKLPGCPKKKRRLKQWELKKDSTRMTKGGLVKRCSKCREVGHNKKRCPNRNEQPVVQAQGEEPTSLGQGATHAEQPHH
ncbi:hypothetical protein V8G54_007061 [Vigna mungo]|uniref:SWIM-type domain-containing protein n=1 Tax=Vigna mungo TaxID=3915 RepID=A0AAQ3P103_VIGMU